MWKIGNLEIKSHVVLGPMAGITSQAYRLFLKPFGVGLSFTEMVSDCGLFYGNQNTFTYLPNKETDHPVGIQLFGSKIENTQKAIEIIQKSGILYDYLDLNFGCPVPKVTKTGAGSAWLKKPQKLKEYVSQIVSYSSKPVTAKIRLGWNAKSINFPEVVEILEQAGVVAITIHARTSEQMYTGKADWSILRGLKQKMKVPLIVSGDIFSLEDAIEAQTITGSDAIMVARGAVGNPHLIRQIDEYFSSGKWLEKPSLADQIKYVLQYSDLLIKEKGEKQAMMILRGIAPRFFSGFAGMKPIKSELTTNLNKRADLEAILKRIK